MYQESELVDEIDKVSVDCNNSEHDGNIFSIFGGNEVNYLVEIWSLIDFKEAYGKQE